MKIELDRINKDKSDTVAYVELGFDVLFIATRLRLFT